MRRILTSRDRQILAERRAVSGFSFDSQVESRAEGYLEQLTKLVPVEFVAAILSIDAAFRASQSREDGGFSQVAYWVVAAFIVAVAPVYLLHVTREEAVPPAAKPLPPATRQVVISTIALVVWMYAIGGPFSYQHNLHDPLVVTIILPLFSLVAPLLLEVRSRKK